MYYFTTYAYGIGGEYTILDGVVYFSDGEMVGSIFDAGASLNDKYGGSTFYLIVNEKETYKAKWTDYIAGNFIGPGNILILSNRACSLLQKIGLVNLEFFNLIIMMGEKCITDYKLVNVIGKYDCIDIDASEIEFNSTGGCKKISKLVLNYSKVPEGVKIFLLGRNRTMKVFIHESVKEAIENNLEGFKFIHANDYKRD